MKCRMCHHIANNPKIGCLCDKCFDLSKKYYLIQCQKCGHYDFLKINYDSTTHIKEAVKEGVLQYKDKVFFTMSCNEEECERSGFA